ncbi:MAG: UMP kinase [Eubacteriaceae bacterium]|jgi:uridylate kinase|nr:UMP kinase [Eubacteriaceae bacterium]
MPEESVKPVYKRVLLKLSGEALAGNAGYGIHQPTILSVCQQIVDVATRGVQAAVVVGGGNIWRGRTGEGMDRATADYMGMLATSINALALQDAIERLGQPVRVQSAISMQEICEPYIRRKAVRHLEKGRVVIFAAGLGSPYFSTDTAAALRAVEIEAEIILSAKNVDGVYSDDPAKNPSAVKYEQLSYQDILENSLKVIDSTAATLCQDNSIPLMIFSLSNPQNIINAVCGERVGTIITNGVAGGKG